MFRQNELIQLSDLLSITAKEDFEIIKAEELLEACTKNEELKFTLLHYTESLNAEVRHFIFENLWHFSGKDVRTAALKHLQDSDTIVQIDCIEILNNYDDIEVIEALKCKLDDRDELVRCFAAESLADKKSSKTLAFLFEKVKTEKSELVTTGLYYAIYTQGEAQVLEKLLHQLESYNHRVIIRTLLMLETISDKKNYPIILEAIQNLASKPGVPISVFEKADSIMDNLTNTFNIK